MSLPSNNVFCYNTKKSWITNSTKVYTLLLNFKASYSIFYDFWLLHPVDDTVFDCLFIKIVVKMVQYLWSTNGYLAIDKILPKLHCTCIWEQIVAPNLWFLFAMIWITFGDGKVLVINLNKPHLFLVLLNQWLILEYLLGLLIENQCEISRWVS